jgi:hypothetical protein
MTNYSLGYQVTLRLIVRINIILRYKACSTPIIQSQIIFLYLLQAQQYTKSRSIINYNAVWPFGVILPNIFMNVPKTCVYSRSNLE